MQLPDHQLVLRTLVEVSEFNWPIVSSHVYLVNDVININPLVSSSMTYLGEILLRIWKKSYIRMSSFFKSILRTCQILQAFVEHLNLVLKETPLLLV